MGSMVSNSVAQPVAGSSTSGSGGFFGRLIEQALNSGILQQVNQQPTQPTGITSIPVSNQNPMVNMTGGRFNPVRDPRLNRVASRPMFKTSRYDNQISDLLSRLIPQTENKANGGRMGYADGSGPIPIGLVDYRGTPWENSFKPVSQPQPKPKLIEMGLLFNPDGSYPGENMSSPIQALPRPGQYSTQIQLPSQQESIKEAIMSLPQTRSNPQINAMRKYSQVRDPRIARLLQQRQARAMGGIMNLKMGGVPSEMDLRARGGFVPIGKKERADDVPARLSKNEFVFTANAVRNAGNGDIRKGAKRMYNLMHQLEAKK
jgi:hypothetical protein